MKVGDKGVNEFESIWRLDEDVGVTGFRDETTLSIGAGLKDASGGGANGNNTLTGSFGKIESGGGGFIEDKGFGMENARLKLLWGDRLKGTYANVKGDKVLIDPEVFKLLKKLWGEVKAGSGGSGRTGIIGVNGLIAKLDLFFGKRGMDVRR